MTDLLTYSVVAAVLLMLVISLRNWRRGIFGLLAFLPFAGVPTIVLYPAPAMTRTLKDLIFLLPAYIGFAKWYMQSRPAARIPRVVAGTAAALTVLVVGHMFGPGDLDLMVGLVGLKTWVLYLPLILIGYHLVRTIEELEDVARWLLLLGLLPIAFGVVQAILVSAGAPELAYRVYGAAAFDVTQGFGRTVVGGGNVVKVASTFTFITQYYNFVLAMLCIAYARWRSYPRRSGHRFWLGLAPLAVVALSGLLTGSRGAFVMIPLFFVVALVLGGEWEGLIQVVMLLFAGLATALTLFKTTGGDLFQVVKDLAINYLTVAQIGEMQEALATTLWGLGTGTNTGPARLATADQTLLGVENYYAKTVMELGLPGLAVVVLLFGAVLIVGYRNSRSIASPTGQVYANSLLAFLIIAVINGWKGSYLDLDPLNVYFWLFAGLLLRIPSMTSTRARTKRPRVAAVRPLWNTPRLSPAQGAGL